MERTEALKRGEVGESDREILCSLASQVARIAAMPVQTERRALWEKYIALQACRPLMLVFPEGSWRELLPDGELRRGGADARGIATRRSQAAANRPVPIPRSWWPGRT